MFCPNCGASIPDGTAFCPNCGASVAASDNTGEQPEIQQTTDVRQTSYDQQNGSYQQTGYDQQSSSFQQTGYDQQNSSYQQADYSQPNSSYQQAGYGQQGYSQQPYQTYTVPVGTGTNRSIPLCIVLSFVTCGIYCFYWMYVLNEEINSLSGETNATNGGLVIVFSLLTCGIYAWYWLYKMGERSDIIKQNMGKASSSSAMLYLIFGIFGLGIVSYALMQDTINSAVG